MRGQGLRNQSAHTQLMELTLCLQQTTEDYSWRPGACSRTWSRRSSGRQTTREQEAILVHLMCQVVNLLQSGATKSGAPLDSRGDVGVRSRPNGGSLTAKSSTE